MRPPPPPSWLRDLSGAWIFYSVLPAWPGIEPRFTRIARFAPWIGAVLGGLQALLWLGLEGRVPVLAQVALTLALALWLTGGLHMDGAMDTADGLAAGERLLEAMDDSRVGAAGAQTLALLLLLRAAALACLGAAAPLALLWAAVWGRVAPLLAMAHFPYLRPGGTAAFHRHHWAGLGVELRPTLLVLAALGLAVVFGLMGVINMAHGELMMIGAYTTFVVQNLFKNGPLEALFPVYILVAIPAAFVVSGLFGLLLEKTVIRRLYGRPLETLLATWGVSLILQQFAQQTAAVASMEGGRAVLP